ncbi:MAG: type II secretion system secretin GspD [Proteobacteria bacterium]|nr:type II secretion system secretin GspD [Pseudomonadota bacterium]
MKSNGPTPGPLRAGVSHGAARVRRQRLARRLLAGALSLALLPVPPVFAQDATAPASSKFRGQPVTLNFVNADIEGVARAMSAILKQPFIVDPRVKGTITLYSEQPLAPRDAYLNFLAALRGLGFTVVEVGGLYKIVPEADAKLQTGTVSIGEVGRRGDQIITQVFRLSNENANNLVPVLRPLISPNNTINANPSSNSLVITDYADNLARIAKIIAAMDVPASGDIEVIPLQHAAAADLQPLVQRLADGGSATPAPVPGAVGNQASTVMVEQRSNSLIVRASTPARMASIRALVAKLDQPAAGAGGSGNIWVVYLKNADAAKLATVLRAAYQPGGSGQGGGQGAAAGGGGNSTYTPPAQTSTPQSPISSTGSSSSTGSTASAQSTTPVAQAASPSTGGFIQADPATNSLIITAPEPVYRQLRAVIDRLDTRRAQVYIESMIVEVDADKTGELGIQWQSIIGNSGDRNIIGLGTNFGTGTDNILGATQLALAGSTALATATLPSNGLNIGLATKFGTHYTLGLLAQALQSVAGTNILSTPNLVTLDNEEAKIVVGQNVPFVTGQYTTSTIGTSSPFQTIERQDVGTTLRIKPQIGANGTIRMIVYQESSSVAATAAVGTANAGPTTNKRSIESTVTVDDGQIIVLGGLIEDNYTDNHAKVPLLGDIPYLGALFRSDSRVRKKTNLMVFLRPIVMRDAADTSRVSLDRYDYIRGEQQNAQPPQNSVIGINGSPTLPPIRPESAKGPNDVPRPLGDMTPPSPMMVPSDPASAPPLSDPASAPR